MVKDVKRTNEPHDRLTRLLADLTSTLDDRDDVDDVKVILFANDDGRGAMVLHGYDDDLDAITDLFIHLKALFEANGKTLAILPAGDLN